MEWSESVTLARRLDEGPLGTGSRTELTQPKLPKRLHGERARAGPHLHLGATGPGVGTTARHDLEVLSGGGTRVRLSVEQAGLLSPLVGRAYAGLTSRYLAMEASGLKARSEQLP